MHAVARAASTRPNRPAPNTAPPAGVGMTRTVGLKPVMPVIRVSNGMSGGWSTQPNARWCPAIRKHSSSCWKPYQALNASSTATNTTAITQASAGTRSEEATGIGRAAVLAGTAVPGLEAEPPG
jgi:hypothetical protein